MSSNKVLITIIRTFSRILGTSAKIKMYETFDTIHETKMRLSKSESVRSDLQAVRTLTEIRKPDQNYYVQ